MTSNFHGITLTADSFSFLPKPLVILLVLGRNASLMICRKSLIAGTDKNQLINNWT